jgi:hypothetical protein
MPHEDSIEAALRAYVDAGTLAGAATMVELQQMASGIGLDAWSAIAKFHELASADAD